MSADIKAGDLVMVVRGMPCCGFMGALTYGIIFTVNGIGTSNEGDVCYGCNKDVSGQSYADGHKPKILTSMLKKIDPPAEGDSLPTRQELKVPA